LKEKQPTKQKSAKNKQILIKRSSKTSNPQVLKNAQLHKKNKPKFVEKLATLAVWLIFAECSTN